eukprot:371097-Amorphochlora_amoeboformis.AAC.1
MREIERPERKRERRGLLRHSTGENETQRGERETEREERERASERGREREREMEGERGRLWFDDMIASEESDLNTATGLVS